MKTVYEFDGYKFEIHFGNRRRVHESPGMDIIDVVPREPNDDPEEVGPALDRFGLFRARSSTFHSTDQRWIAWTACATLDVRKIKCRRFISDLVNGCEHLQSRINDEDAWARELKERGRLERVRRKHGWRPLKRWVP